MKEDTIWVIDMERESMNSMKDGERIVGQFVNDKAEGEHKCYDKQGNIKILHCKDGNLVEN